MATLPMQRNPMQNENSKIDASPSFSVNVSNQLSDIGGCAVQQDSGRHLAIQDERGLKCHAVIVADGHGFKGETISQMVVETFSNIIGSLGFYDRFKQNPKEVASHMFAVAQENVRRSMIERLEASQIYYEIRDGHIHSESSILKGGTTATVILADEDGNVFTMNVADSEAWLVTESDSIKLTADHLPETMSEYERIQANWPTTQHVYDIHGRERPTGSNIFPQPSEGYYYSDVNDKWATVVSVKGCRLAFTRAIGDECMRQGGIISEPDTLLTKITGNSIIKVASDGFWDNIRHDTMTTKTYLDVEKYGLDAVKLGNKWFETNLNAAMANFGRSRDNMLGYIITMVKKE
jgi:serine/threonine protein phosphatase PrpC